MLSARIRSSPDVRLAILVNARAALYICAAPVIRGHTYSQGVSGYWIPADTVRTGLYRPARDRGSFAVHLEPVGQTDGDIFDDNLEAASHFLMGHAA